jgi:hypothetical protein
MSDPRAQWWVDHVHHTREYVNGVFNKMPMQAIAAIKGLWHGVLEWAHLTGIELAAPLMGEHTIVAKLYVDSSARGFKPKESDYLVEYFLKNADSQADLYASAIPGFPKAEFRRLFTDHIVFTGAYIADAGKGDLKAFESDFKKVLENMHALANFSAQYFPLAVPVDGMDDINDDGVEDVDDSDEDLDSFGDSNKMIE